jgi:hypothetical protein
MKIHAQVTTNRIGLPSHLLTSRTPLRKARKGPSTRAAFIHSVHCHLAALYLETKFFLQILDCAEDL